MNEEYGGEGKLNRLVEMLIEETLSMSDDEILVDAAEDTEEGERRLRTEVDAAIAAHRRLRLAAAREEVAASKRAPRLVRRPQGDLRAAIARAVASNDTSLTLAARDGRDLPDADLEGLADDLRDLGFDIGEGENPDAR